MTEHESSEVSSDLRLSPEQCHPVDLHLDKKDGLGVTWGDGKASRYSLAFLRMHCPCATCRSGREERTQEPGSHSLRVLPADVDRAVMFTNARLVGNYALQITWGDGHDTGIYDFRFLRALSTEGRRHKEGPGSD